MLTKKESSNNTEETSTCSDGTAKPEIEVGKTDNDAEQPPQKRKRLSNREYKKLTKGQNKVS